VERSREEEVIPMQLTPEQKKEQIEKYLKVGGAIVIGVVVAPVIFYGIGGLIGLAIAGAIGFTGIQMMPVFANRVAVWRMKLLISDAQKNPIETMRLIYIDNMKVIETKDEKIKNFQARLGDYVNKMDGFRKKYPEEAPRYQEVADKMGQLLQRQKQKQKVAKQKAVEYHDQIEKASAIYDMALEANAVTQLAGDVEKQVFQEIRKQVSFDSVNHSFNQAVAELSSEVDTEPDFALPGSVRSELPA
jgi:hypothetical protein